MPDAPARNPGVRARAFGMDIEADFAMPGVEPSRHAGDGRTLTLRTGDRADVVRGFDADVERIAELRFDDGRLAVSVDDGGDRGYLMHAFDFGYARLSPGGDDVLISPFEENPAWIWQRYLTGQVLPLAALLHGLEVFHACVLGLGTQAVAVVALSGVGKTTTALHLALDGLEFMSDDVLVLEPTEDGVMAHPGVGLANVRPPADELLQELERAGLAKPIGRRERETRISIPRLNEARPLGALFVLNRFPDDRPLEVERLKPVDPRMLLASTFNFSVQTPERLARQLEACAQLERSAAVFGMSCGVQVTPREVADAVLQNATQAAPC